MKMNIHITSAARRIANLCAVSVSTFTPLSAQAPSRLTGYTWDRSTRQLQVEAELRAVIDTANSRRLSEILSSEPHVAGTPRQRWTAEFVDSLTTSWGYETKIDSYLVYLPHPLRLSVSRIGSEPLALETTEPPVPGDPATEGEIFPQFNAYTGRGDVTAEVIYVNYGLIEDYEALDSAGVSVEGKIAIARYGRSYRGIKAREAERHGALGLLLYSDPTDDGYVQGDVYPEGPFRPPHGVQRGSVKIDRGDPSSPGGPSDYGRVRLPESEMQLPRIPVAPIGYAAAAELLEGLRGQSLPAQSWQGGLPFRYHVGPGPVSARLIIDTEKDGRAYHAIFNTLAFLSGMTHPDEWIVVGAHRDAWGPGALDNVSGTVSVLEAARAFGELAAGGFRPERTVVFATWDAEEWGIIGSTEFVERFEDELSVRVVAYINQDVTAAGRQFDASGSGSLKPLIREVTMSVENPFGEGTLYEAWAESQGLDEGQITRIGDLGGGSDYVGFYNHLGIPSVNFGFRGSGGAYHSAYDTHRWISEFGDPGFLAHAGAARLTATLAARLANADMIPFDYREFAEQLAELSATLATSIESRNWSVHTVDLDTAVSAMRIAAAEVAELRSVVLLSHPDASLSAINRELMTVDKALTREAGLAGRPWFRNLVFAADRDNGYSNVPLPSISEAIRDGDPELTASELADVASRVSAAREILSSVARTLETIR